MKEYRISVPDIRRYSELLKAGDRVLLSGEVYTARDAAHRRFFEGLQRGEQLPFPVQDAVIYYAGPTPVPQGLPVGSCGPTTSSRMDRYAPELLDRGLCAMIGKGPRAASVIEAIRRNHAVYFCAVGGAGALAARCIRELTVIAYEDLGCESVKKLYMEDFPLTVGIDATGRGLFAPFEGT